MCRGIDDRLHVKSVVSARMHGVTKRLSFIVLNVRTQVPVSFVCEQLVDNGGPCRSKRPRRLLRRGGGSKRPGRLLRQFGPMFTAVVNGPAVYYADWGCSKRPGRLLHPHICVVSGRAVYYGKAHQSPPTDHIQSSQVLTYAYSTQ